MADSSNGVGSGSNQILPLTYKLIIRQLMDDGHSEAAALISKQTNTIIDSSLSAHSLRNMVEASNLLNNLEEPHSSQSLPQPSLNQDDNEKSNLEKKNIKIIGIADDEENIEALDDNNNNTAMAIDGDGNQINNTTTNNNELIIEKKSNDREFLKLYNDFSSTHKDDARAAVFSRDGQFAATGSIDSSVKLLDVSRMAAYSLSEVRKMKADDRPKPMLKTFYEHEKPVVDLDFHPFEPFLMSAGMDGIIAFYDLNRLTYKKAYRTIAETHPIRTASFHPSGDFLVVGTENPQIRIYDVHTFQGYITADSQSHHVGAINCVRFAPRGETYASCSKDGTVKIWDTASSTCIRTIQEAHGPGASSVVCSVSYSPSGKYILSNGKDNVLRLWEIGTGKLWMEYRGAKQSTFRVNSTFFDNGNFVVSGDEEENGIVMWDTRTGTLGKKLLAHKRTVRFVAASQENQLMSVGDDATARFWSPITSGLGEENDHESYVDHEQ